MKLGCLMREGRELGQNFQAFEEERRPRAERIVAIARRNGNSKREFSATGAWIRDRMPSGTRGWTSCTVVGGTATAARSGEGDDTGEGGTVVCRSAEPATDEASTAGRSTPRSEATRTASPDTPSPFAYRIRRKATSACSGV